MTTHDVPDGEFLAAVWAVTHTIVQLGQQHGPLPRLRSREFLAAPDAVKVAVLLVLAEAWIVGEGLVDEVSTADYAGGRYHRAHVFPAITELERRRYPPTGDRDLWIKYGPSGPPAEVGEVEAA